MGELTKREQAEYDKLQTQLETHFGETVAKDKINRYWEIHRALKLARIELNERIGGGPEKAERLVRENKKLDSRAAAGLRKLLGRAHYEIVHAQKIFMKTDRNIILALNGVKPENPPTSTLG